MELEFTDEQEDLRASVRAVLERECPMTVVREVVEKGTGAERLWTQLTELGWPALTVPEGAGGLGLGFVELAVVVEELGRVVAPVPYLATVTQFVPVIREAGDADQQARFLGRVATGETTGALVGNGITARRDGDRWLLTGVDPYVLDGTSADELAVVARVDDGDGVGLFVVAAEDVAATPVNAFDASRPLARIELDAIAVGPDRVLGPSGAVA